MLALPKLTILSDSQLMQESITTAMRLSLADVELEEHVTLIIDDPLGFASETLFRVSGLKIVMTSNLCPEYLDDLWDLEPTVLITSDSECSTLLQTIKRAQQGKRKRITPTQTSHLTRMERKVLRLSSYGLSVKAIANRTETGPHSVQNHLTSIYDKLSVKGKEEATRYYWGLSGLPT